jgi:thiol-disulfide isomerase/thioredoxin
MRATWLALAAAFFLSACGTDRSGGSGFDLADYNGRWLVINYWAEWCKPCIKEIPELNALDAKYPQVAVVGVNFDGETGEVLRQQIDRLGIAFPVLGEEPSATLGVALPLVLPATFIFDPDGKLAHSLVGPQTLESLAAATGQIGMPAETEASNELQPN